MKKPQKAALTKPAPALGAAVHTKIPDGMDGIRYEIGRILKFIQDSRKDPLVISTARKIASLSIETAKKLGRKVDDRTRPFILLKGIHAWCVDNFVFVNDPINVEVIQTPGRMLRDLEFPVQIAEGIWTPIRKAMVAGTRRKGGVLTLPKPKMTGDSDEAVVISLSLAAALGIHPLKMRFGGEDGTVRYVWGAGWAKGRWWDFDILHEKFGKHHLFDMYQDLEVEL